jgi:hypothetical protein
MQDCRCNHRVDDRSCDAAKFLRQYASTAPFCWNPARFRKSCRLPKTPGAFEVTRISGALQGFAVLQNFCGDSCMIQDFQKSYPAGPVENGSLAGMVVPLSGAPSQRQVTKCLHSIPNTRPLNEFSQLWLDLRSS